MYIKYGISDYKYLYIVLYMGAFTMLTGIQNRHAISIDNMDCVYEMEFGYEMDMKK